MFPNFVRQFAAGGAEVLFNISNDGWFGKSAAREQHLSMVRMRAAENRRWILRSTNDGITATIDPAGRLRGTLPLYTEATSYTGFSYVQRADRVHALRRLVPAVLRDGGVLALVAAPVAVTVRVARALTVPDHQHVAILDDVLLAFQPQQALCRARRDSRRDRPASSSSPPRRG